MKVFSNRQIEDENKFPVFIAEAEKTLVDFFYLNLSNFSKDEIDVFEYSYRFQNFSLLDIKKLKKFAQIFHNKKLLKIVDNFCQFIILRR